MNNETINVKQEDITVISVIAYDSKDREKEGVITIKATVIAIFNAKGGTGKTTTAINLQDCLNRKKKKTLIIDMDPSRYSSTTYKAKIKDEATLADILFQGIEASECIQHTSMGDIIPSDDLLLYDFDELQMKLDRKNKYYILKERCKSIEHMYDYVIIDTPPTNNLFLGNALTYADKVLIPTTPDVYGIEGMADVPKMLQYYRQYNPYLSVIGVVIVRYKKMKYTLGCAQTIEEFVTENLHSSVFKTYIRECVRCSEAAGYGVSLQEYAPKCNTALDYMEMVREFLKRERM